VPAPSRTVPINGCKAAPHEERGWLKASLQAILAAVHRTASDAKTRNQQSLKVTHRLSAEMQATEDRIRELEAKVRHHEERADRAEKWLYRITLETEQQLLGREQGLPLQPPPL
jgi:hypothetical protein